MVSTVNKKIIEMILNREMKFTDFNFKPDTWNDAFIVELLKWYDNKIKIISKKYEHYQELFDDSKTYKVGDPLYCDATGKLTNVKAGNGIVVAYVIKGVKDYAGKKIMRIRSQQKYQVV